MWQNHTKSCELLNDYPHMSNCLTALVFEPKVSDQSGANTDYSDQSGANTDIATKAELTRIIRI